MQLQWNNVSLVAKYFRMKPWWKFNS